MGKPQSSEERRAYYAKALPASLAELFPNLKDEVVWLHFKWKDYRRLFADEPTTIASLNKVAPRFFGRLQWIMWEDTLLHLSRITDPIKTAGKDNLTLKRLPGAIPDLDLQTEVHSRLKKIEQATEFARDWRNRRLAHLELPPPDGQAPKPLADASHQHVEDALVAVRGTMNAVEVHYLDSSTVYEHPVETPGGVASLVGHLESTLS